MIAPADDLAILLPDRRVTLETGEVVEVREFSVRDGLAANAFAFPLIAAIEALFAGDAVDDVAPHLVWQAFGEHIDITMRLLALATGKDVEWLEMLGDDDGQALLVALWGANTGFFTRRLVALRRARQFATPMSSAS